MARAPRLRSQGYRHGHSVALRTEHNVMASDGIGQVTARPRTEPKWPPVTLEKGSPIPEYDHIALRRACPGIGNGIVYLVQRPAPGDKFI